MEVCMISLNSNIKHEPKHVLKKSDPKIQSKTANIGDLRNPIEHNSRLRNWLESNLGRPLEKKDFPVINNLLKKEDYSPSNLLEQFKKHEQDSRMSREEDNLILTPQEKLGILKNEIDDLLKDVKLTPRQHEKIDAHIDIEFVKNRSPERIKESVLEMVVEFNKRELGFDERGFKPYKNSTLEHPNGVCEASVTNWLGIAKSSPMSEALKITPAQNDALQRQVESGDYMIAFHLKDKIKATKFDGFESSFSLKQDNSFDDKAVGKMLSDLKGKENHFVVLSAYGRNGSGHALGVLFKENAFHLFDPNKGFFKRENPNELKDLLKKSLESFPEVGASKGVL